MYRVPFVFVGLAGVQASQNSDFNTVALFEKDSKEAQDPRLEDTLSNVYASFAKQFPAKEYESFLQTLEGGMQEFKQSEAYTGYKTGAFAAHCDAGAPASFGSAASGVAAFPGGIVKRQLGADLAKSIFNLCSGAKGMAGASSAMVGPLTAVATQTGAAMIQAIVSTVLDIVPPMIPPPVWIMQPLNCMPMVTGHNCMGAVLYPITMSDFVLADVTDAQLDGVIAGFPALYSRKVGKTSDATYKQCFNSYMSLQCSHIFPMCTAPFGRNEAIPGVGRVPTCFTHCLATLVMCPGFWLEDIMGQCQMVAAPPMCSFALFLNSWRAPGQYVSYEESHAAPLECPKTDLKFDALDASKDFSLYSDSSIAASPITGAAGVPSF